MQNLVYLLLVSLSLTRLSFFKVGMAEFTLFHLLVVVVLFFRVFIAIGRKNLKWKQPLYFSIAFLYIAAVNLVNLQQVKLSSFIYSLLILMELVLLYNIVSGLSIQTVKRVMKAILLLYFINIVVATAFITFRFYPGGMLGSIFQIYIFDHRIRPYGFSDEPSYAAIILVFTLFTFFKCDDFLYQKKDLKWYVMGMVSVFLTGSSYGYMILAILLFYFMVRNRFIFTLIETVRRHKLFSRKELGLAVLLFIGVIWLVYEKTDLKNNKSINRLINVIGTLTKTNDEITGNIKQVAYVDGSASMRVVPTLLMFDEYKNDRLRNVIFGRGAGSSVPFFTRLYQGDTTLLGFMPSFVYNYGLFGGALFFLFFLSLFPRKKLLLFMLFFLFLFNADFNTQIFVYVLFTIMTARQIERQRTNAAAIE